MSNISEQRMTRKDFLKKVGLGTAGTILALKGIAPVQAGAVTFSDNLKDSAGGGVTVGSLPPEESEGIWIDTSTGHGIMKYFDTVRGTWEPCAAVWG